MDHELTTLDDSLKEELAEVKRTYSYLKAEVKKKYRELEKEKKRMEKEKTKKLRTSIPKSLRILVWNKNIGKEKGIGGCYVCNEEIDSKNFECGHIISVKDAGETHIDNLRPICSSCNKSMGTQNLHDFKKTYFPVKETMKIETKLNSTIEEYCRKLKYNEEQIKQDIDCPSTSRSRNQGCMDQFYGYQGGSALYVPQRFAPRELKLDDIYTDYRKWLSVSYPAEYSDKQFEGCYGLNETSEKVKVLITKRFGEPVNLAKMWDPSEMGKTVVGWKNIEII